MRGTSVVLRAQGIVEQTPEMNYLLCVGPWSIVALAVLVKLFENPGLAPHIQP